MSPFDHPEIWDGHATLAEELARDLPKPVRRFGAVHFSFSQPR